MKLRFLLVLTLLGLFSAACFGQVEKGKASYYSEHFKGRKTASGERYHPDSLTCAHRTQPFGTLLLVSCASKGTSVVVRVNDRGPFGKGRVVDLSTEAARKLGIILAGVAEVEVQVYLPQMMAPLFPQPSVPDPLTRREVVNITELNPKPWSPNPYFPQQQPVPTDKGLAKGKPKAKTAKRSHSSSQR
ncbi:MAG: septal ring lytic transglycosylase RlpA family protein [Bacteroidia bacterium]|nr:septal ring lytic transglycosylase RlpA family protein [Bacteroidota bacterium]MBP6640481.1 septal ring lytic transglycosylase RlpA family protein [Bacteroidia bacterium]